jgi:lysophospholipase L1-like esterase
MTAHITLSGKSIRIQVSNTFGDSPLPVTKVTVGHPGSGKAGASTVETASLKQVTFGGKSSVTIPAGQITRSDPIDFPVTVLQDISISMFFAQGHSGRKITGHPGSRTTTWLAKGDHTTAADMSKTAYAKGVAHWYYISTIEVQAASPAAAFVIVGDSITDGRGSDDNANNRWADFLVKRMQNEPATKSISVINEAAGGNCVLRGGLGPPAITRIQRDVLQHSGVKYAMIFEGVNDIGAGADASSLISAYSKMIDQMHAAGIIVFGGTITAFAGSSYASGGRDGIRTKVNDWIRTSKKFDGVVDFDAVTRDKANKAKLATPFDSGDRLHLNVKGYSAMADAFDLKLFAK